MSDATPPVPQSEFGTIFLVEDDGARSHRRSDFGFQRSHPNPNVTVRVHRIVDGAWQTVCGEAQVQGPPSPTGQRKYKQTVALDLLDTCHNPQQHPLVVAGASYGSSVVFTTGLVKRGLDFIIEIRPGHAVQRLHQGQWVSRTAVSALRCAVWRDIAVTLRHEHSSSRYSVADLGEVHLPADAVARLFVAQTGGIQGLHRGTIIGLTSLRSASLEDLVRSIGWVRWIRPLIRRQERKSLEATIASQLGDAPTLGHDLTLPYRSNITLARRRDHPSSEGSKVLRSGIDPPAKKLAGANVVNVVDLFAGAGGMGLGFLMAEHASRRYRLIFEGELHPVYTKTLQNTHAKLVEMRRSRWVDCVPKVVEPLNLSDRKTLELVVSEVSEAGGVDIVVGGPPCQGFSNANRNSWSSANPQNRMVDVFLKYVEELNPSMFLIENVQGIAWTARNGKSATQASVARYIVERMEKTGYVVFPTLLDAVWYGVPQFRTRFFVVGIHRDAGYSREEFGDWGPFPVPTHGPLAGRPFVTVRDAIGDLPVIGNGHGLEVLDYREPTKGEDSEFLSWIRNDALEATIMDHITSRHADYVIERYKRIPAGGNWQNIKEMMSNYSRLERTHSNIYRRLEWDEPSITIGHYRKSMIVHPGQPRGLSVREASRLQSFPDWFRFAGTVDGRPGGLMHKQQQLANAVCPLMSKAIAEFLLEL